jgi:cation:H+ antiporter
MALLVWFEFFACTLVIWVAGVRLSRYGDQIAAKSGTSRTWVGVVLLASVTSLPELVTGLSSAGLAGIPDLAIGDVLGSCVFNLLILVIVDFIYRQEPVYARASIGHILSAAFGVVLLGVAAFGIGVGALGRSFRIAHVAVVTPVLIVGYAVAMRAVFRYEQRQEADYLDEAGPARDARTLRELLVHYALWSLVVVAGGASLPFIGDQIALTMGWEHSFVGTLLIALATSTPEVVVTIAAVRQGALDLAVGNLLGSNLFNLLILGLDDLVYRRGPLLEAGAPVNIISAISALTMSGIVIVGLIYRPRQRVLRTVGWVSVVLFVVYLLNAWILFAHGRSG